MNLLWSMLVPEQYLGFPREILIPGAAIPQLLSINPEGKFCLKIEILSVIICQSNVK